MKTNLWLARKARKMTQRELAAEVGLTRAAISALETGARKGTVSNWDKFERFFGVAQQELRKEAIL